MTSEPTRRSGSVDRLSPDGLVKNPAFSQVAVVSGPVRTIYVGGQDAVAADGEIVGIGDLGAQTVQILANVETALAAADAGLEHVVKWTLLVVEGQDLRTAFVQGLARPEFLAEMDAIAVVPE